MFLFFLACQSEPKPPSFTEDKTVITEGHVRFVAIGDAGEGNDAQFAVADVVEQVCTAQGCDFAIYLGDNFYDVGVESVDDISLLISLNFPTKT